LDPSALAIDSNGNKWLTCQNGFDRDGINYLFKFDGQSWTKCDTTNSELNGANIFSMIIDSKDNKWISTSNGVIKYDGKNWEKINVDRSYNIEGPIYTLKVDKKGHKWLFCDNSISEFDGTNLINYTPDNSGLINTSTVYIIAIDQDNTKWFGSDGYGLCKFDGTNWQTFNTQNSGLPDNTINALIVDSKGNKWVCTNKGIAKFDGNNWQTYNSQNSGLPDNAVFTATIDAKGNKWFGTANGLAKFDGNSWVVYNYLNSPILSAVIYNLTADSINNIWLGSYYTGVYKFDGIKWTVFDTTNSSIPGSSIYSISSDSKNNIWICGFIKGFGIAKYNGTTWQTYNTLNSGISSDLVFSLAIDPQDNKWIGTYLDGICEFTGGKEDANGNSVSGNIVYDNTSNSPIPNCKVYLTQNGSSIDSASAAADGSFKFNSVQNGSYSIKLGNMPAWGGVNSTDALWLRQFVIGARSFDSLQIKASDVNLSGSVNSTDALLIRQRTVNLINSFPVADWVYYSPFVTINNANANVTIKTLCAGDLNNSYVPSGAKRTAAVMLADNGQIKPAMASEFELPVTVNKSMSISGLTLLFDYNSKYFDVVGIKSKIEGLTYSINNGKIKIAWDDLSPISFNEGDNIISLILKAVNKNKSQNCDFQLTLNGESELADANGNSIGNVVLSVPSLSDNIVKDYQLMQNYPNPFNPSTTIKYALPVDSYVDMAVYNVLGQKVKTLINGIKAMGSYDVKFDAGNLPSGVYFYSLDAKSVNSSKNFHQVYKLMIMK